MKIQQGEIYLATLDPRRGREQGGTRPVVIVSGNTMNEHFDVVIVCPISSKVKKYEGCVILPKGGHVGLKCDSEIITFQIRALSKERLSRRIGLVNKDELREIFRGLLLVLTH